MPDLTGCMHDWKLVCCLKLSEHYIALFKTRTRMKNKYCTDTRLVQGEDGPGGSYLDWKQVNREIEDRFGIFCLCNTLSIMAPIMPLFIRCYWKISLMCKELQNTNQSFNSRPYDELCIEFVPQQNHTLLSVVLYYTSLFNIESNLYIRPLKWTWKCDLYEQLSFTDKLKLYALFIHGGNETDLSRQWFAI